MHVSEQQANFEPKPGLADLPGSVNAVLHRAFHDHWTPGDTKPLDLYVDSLLWQEMAQAVAEHLTSESALAAFREAWEQADAEGAAGDRVRRGMAAAIEAVS